MGVGNLAKVLWENSVLNCSTTIQPLPYSFFFFPLLSAFIVNNLVKWKDQKPVTDLAALLSDKQVSGRLTLSFVGRDCANQADRKLSETCLPLSF